MLGIEHLHLSLLMHDSSCRQVFPFFTFDVQIKVVFPPQPSEENFAAGYSEETGEPVTLQVTISYFCSAKNSRCRPNELLYFYRYLYFSVSGASG